MAYEHLTVNAIAADDLAMQRAMASTAMVKTYFSWNIPVSTFILIVA